MSYLLSYKCNSICSSNIIIVANISCFSSSRMILTKLSHKLPRQWIVSNLIHFMDSREEYNVQKACLNGCSVVLLLRPWFACTFMCNSFTKEKLQRFINFRHQAYAFYVFSKKNDAIIYVNCYIWIMQKLHMM